MLNIGVHDMLYIRVEDSKDGLELCKFICELYSKEEYDIESLGGIFDATKKISRLLDILSKEDRLVIVCDSILENPLVKQSISALLDMVWDRGANDKVSFVYTVSFELEILLINGINLLTNAEAYKRYVEQIKKSYETYNDTRRLTLITKANQVYKGMYDKIRKRKRNRGIYKSMTDEDFEVCITIESLSKELIKELFREQPIGRPLTTCWIQPCCYRRNRCKTRLIDTYRISEEQKQKKDNYIKLHLLISNTSYMKLAALLGDGILIKYTIFEFLNESAMEANYINKYVHKD